MLRNPVEQNIRHVVRQYQSRLGALDPHSLYTHPLRATLIWTQAYSTRPTDAFSLSPNSTIANIFDYAQKKASQGISISDEQILEGRRGKRGGSRGRQRRTLRIRRYRSVVAQRESPVGVVRRFQSDRPENKRLITAVPKHILPLRDKELARERFDTASRIPSNSRVISSRTEGSASSQSTRKTFVPTNFQRRWKYGRPYEIRKYRSLRKYHPIRQTRASIGDSLGQAPLKASTDSHARGIERTELDGTRDSHQQNARSGQRYSLRQVRSQRRRQRAKKFALLHSQLGEQMKQTKAREETLRKARDDPFDFLQGIGEGLKTAPPASMTTIEDGVSEESQQPPWADMPLSPLMHPGLLAARGRYHAKKALPSKDPTEFEAKVARNPFAQMLAQPVRTCRITGARLPLPFLAKFTMLKHPESDALWQVPISYHPSPVELSFLDHNKPAAASRADATLLAEDGEDDITSTDLIESPAEDASEPTTATEIPDQSSSNAVSRQPGAVAEKPKPGRGKLAGAYILATRSAIDEVSKLKPAKLNSIYPVRWRNYFGRDLVKRGHWRKDMGSFTHVLIRRKAMRLLAHVAQLEHYVFPFHPKRRDLTTGITVLWLDPPSRIGRQERFEEFIHSITSSYDYKPHSVHPASSSFVLHGAQGRVLSVFNLPSLLGDDGVSWLRDRNAIFTGHHAVFIFDKKATADAVSWFWRLVNYRSEEESQSLTDVGRFKEKKELSEVPEEEAVQNYLLSSKKHITRDDEVSLEREKGKDKDVEDVH